MTVYCIKDNIGKEFDVEMKHFQISMKLKD